MALLLVFFIIKPYLYGKEYKKSKGTKAPKSHFFSSNELKEKYKEHYKSKNYRLALRYYFLYLISIMEDSGMLYIDRSLTNNEYVNLLKKAEIDKGLTVRFSEIVSIFEKKWYGLIDVSSNDIENFSGEINGFLEVINESQ
ncbi:hypothetical protein J7L48_10240 [bacterium]|nr:hypothetical protein [bacterium]